MEKVFDIKFDSKKSDLTLSLDFLGVMNVGFAMILLDGTTPLWVPPTIKDNIVNSDGIITIKKDFVIMKPLLQNDKVLLKIKCKCRGLKIDKHPTFLIVANILQEGVKINHVVMDGDLKEEIIDVTFVVNLIKI